MALWQILLISVGLSLDVFAYCLYKGAMISTVDIPNMTKMTAIFTGFQAGMMIVGCGITRIPAMARSYKPFGKSFLSDWRYYDCEGAYQAEEEN